jgi:flagellar hook assembly protein FlgD
VSLVIYNVLGQKIRTLVEEPRSAGRYQVVWDGRDDRGMTVGSGTYFCRLQAGDFAIVQKMLLLK